MPVISQRTENELDTGRCRSSGELVRWFQLICLDGARVKARPKKLRWSVFHSPGRLVRSARRDIVRIPRRLAKC
jgi:hypothetical protein